MPGTALGAEDTQTRILPSWTFSVESDKEIQKQVRLNLTGDKCYIVKKKTTKKTKRAKGQWDRVVTDESVRET